MAIYPWVRSWDQQGQDIEEYPNVLRWMRAIAARPAVQSAYALVEDINPNDGVELDDEARWHLFGQR